MFIVQVFLWIYYAEHQNAYILHTEDNIPENEIFLCAQNYPSHILIILPLLDIIICILCSILFVRRLISFNVFVSRNNGKINQYYN